MYFWRIFPSPTRWFQQETRPASRFSPSFNFKDSFWKDGNVFWKFKLPKLRKTKNFDFLQSFSLSRRKTIQVNKVFCYTFYSKLATCTGYEQKHVLSSKISLIFQEKSIDVNIPETVFTPVALYGKPNLIWRWNSYNFRTFGNFQLASKQRNSRTLRGYFSFHT